MIEELLAKHKKENMDLIKSTQELKHSIPIKNKKKRKEIMSQILKMENDLKDRQIIELGLYQPPHAKDNILSSVIPSFYVDKDINRLSKFQKRIEKKSKSPEHNLSNEENVDYNNNMKKKFLEEEEIKKKLAIMHADIYDIKPDGDCFYHAIAHQLSIKNHISPKECFLNNFSNLSELVKQLRKFTSEYMLAHQEVLLPFTDNITIQDYKKYCEDISYTHNWAGNLEIHALSNFLKMPITIIQANSPNIDIGKEYLDDQNSLFITYHHYLYALGPHYNSVITNL